MDWDSAAVLVPDRKLFRTAVIRRYLFEAGRSCYAGTICFTSGAAGQALREAMDEVWPRYPVVTVGPGQALDPGPTWWTPERIASVWPGYFDATPGHLPPWLMARLAVELQRGVDEPLPMAVHDVPSGSGETVVALAMAFPGVRFRPVYVDGVPSLQYHEQAPLNPLVAALCQAWNTPHPYIREAKPRSMAHAGA